MPDVDDAPTRDVKWPLPSTIYRFRIIDRAREILETNTLNFASPSSFNDPFDCQIVPSFGKSPDRSEQFARLLARHNHPQMSRREQMSMVKMARQHGDLEKASFDENLPESEEKIR